MLALPLEEVTDAIIVICGIRFAAPDLPAAPVGVVTGQANVVTMR